MDTPDNPKTSVGILYPGYAAEDDYPLAEQKLGGDVRLAVAHTEMKLADDHTPEAMKAAGDPDVLSAGAKQLLSQVQLDSIIWACTSGSFAWGWDDAARQARELQQVAGVPASSTSFAFADAVHHLNLKRVAIAATYPADLAELFRTFLGRAGIEVVQLGSRGVFTASEVGASMGRQEVLAFVADNDHPDAEAILVPDTALHSIAWLEDLEQQAGKPVLTANQVSIWQGLRLAGADLRRDGLGSLFR